MSRLAVLAVLVAAAVSGCATVGPRPAHEGIPVVACEVVPARRRYSKTTTLRFTSPWSKAS